jgi:hypothetical protein
MSMPDFPIDPELRIRAPPASSTAPHNRGCRVYSEDDIEPTWPRLARDVLQSFEVARDEWSAMEAVVYLELLLEAEGLLIEERTAHASPPGQDRFRAA